MFPPDLEGVILEAGDEIGHAAGDGDSGLDAEFVDEGGDSDGTIAGHFELATSVQRTLR